VRAVTIHTPAGRGRDAERVARAHNAANIALTRAERDGEAINVLTAAVSNRRLGEFLADVEEEIDGVHALLAPQGVFALKPPPEEAPDQVIDVQIRSPIEIVLAGLQSIGSWNGLCIYAAAAGIVVWIGLATGATYLLIAAMLIAPFAGPAMNAALASAAGDAELLARAVLRYAVSIAITIAVAAAISFPLLEGPSPMMLKIAKVSGYAVLLPITAGVAGAVFLIQSERDSLVSGAAVGVLVAASLALPAGVVGMALALARWDLVIPGAFVLALQLAGINLAAATVFFFAGVRPNTQRYKRGRRAVFPVSLAVAAAGAGALLWWQLTTPVELRRGSLELALAAEAAEIVERQGGARVLESSARFANRTSEAADVAVVSLTIAGAPPEARDVLSSRIVAHFSECFPSVRPAIDLTMVDLPPPAR
jgi:uncharacterized membrane protein